MIRKIINYINRFVKKSYSLEGEDLITDRYFDYKNEGFYVDIGANHPIRFSNTYLFYRKNWIGINIDGDQYSIDLLRKKRNKDINIHSYIGANNKVKKFISFNESALNTFSQALANKYKKIGYKVLSSKKVKTVSLERILDKHMPKETLIDFMSIDVEGLELDVLKSNNWDKYRPKLIIVEILDLTSLEDVLNHKITKYLKSKGYYVSMKTVTNCFYVAK